MRDLPVELWSQVFEYVDSPRDQWLNCRDVSHRFRYMIENLFRQTYLPNVHIALERLLDVRLDHDESQDFTLEEVRGDIATYKLFDSTAFKKYPAEREELSSRLDSIGSWDQEVKGRSTFLHPHIQPWELSTMFVVFHDTINDVPLPGLQANKAEPEISFHWKLMLSWLFREEDYCRNILANELEKTKAEILSEPRGIDVGLFAAQERFENIGDSVRIRSRNRFRKRYFRQAYSEDYHRCTNPRFELAKLERIRQMKEDCYSEDGL